MRKPQVLGSLAGILLSLGGLLVWASAQSAKDPLLPGKHLDRTLFPKAYGILANESLYFPVDLSDWPVKIDHAHQLFLDDYLIAGQTNLEREVHRPRKHPANPLLIPDKPWEGNGVAFQIVHRDEKTGRFRMWYTTPTRYRLPSGMEVRFPALYAESKDGLTWEKPNLGLYASNGSKANNIIIPAGNLYGLIHEPHEPDPNRVYKGMVWHEPPYVPREGYFLYTSPDGLRWQRARQEPLALSLNGYTMPQSGIGDTSIFRWDRHLRKYVGDVKFVLPGRFRCRGMMESDDLIHWTPPRLTLYPDALDEADSEVYGHLSFCYESMWIGFLRMMHTQRTGWKQTTVELTASRDGRHWTRVGRREEFLPLGDRTAWDADYHDPSWDPILVGEELWIYYRSLNRQPPPGKTNVGHAIGLATLRRDGFVSLNADEQPGTLRTRPMALPGGQLHVNADLRGGSLRVAVLDQAGQPVKGFEASEPVSMDATKVVVSWGNADLDRLRGQTVRLQFTLQKGKLFSFWME